MLFPSVSRNPLKPRFGMNGVNAKKIRRCVSACGAGGRPAVTVAAMQRFSADEMEGMQRECGNADACREQIAMSEICLREAGQ
jgi:hypothetical protein